MKRIRLFSSVCLLVLTLACLTFGVYSAVKTTFTASGTITFNAYNLDVDAKVTITGTEETYEPKYLASNKDRTEHQMQGTYSEMSDIELNKLTFDELSGKRNVITVKFELYNYSNFQVEVSATTTLLGNAENNLYYQPLAGTLMDKSEKTGHNQGTFEISFAPKGEAIIDSTTNVKIAVEIKPVTTEFDTQAGSLVYNYMTYTLDTSNNTAETALDVVWEDYWNEDEKYATYPTDTFSVASNIAGYNVTTIAEDAFYDPNDDNPHSFEYMFVPNGVTEIGDSAFTWVELEYVNFPNTLETINRYAFGNIYSLKEVYIPSSVTDLGLVVNDDYVELAFNGIYDCQSIKIEEGNTVYDSRNDCNAIIETATNTLLLGCNNSFVPSGVVNIEISAFNNCNKLTSITIPSSVTSIGKSAFDSCSSLTSITIPNSVVSIGDYAFRACSGLTSITIQNGVASIGDDAFTWCTSLTEVTIPSTVTSVGRGAFSGCSNITKISIPACVTDIKATFSSCYNKLTDITLQDGWISINDNTFKNCTNLISITILNTVKEIGSYAFSGCSNLTSITIPDSVTSIGSYAFSGCSSLTTITLPMGITEINGNIFLNCTSLKLVSIPKGVINIGSSAFDGCSNLTSITIPDSVTSIGSYAFSGCSSLTTITLPMGITEINSNIFLNCTSLKLVSIPKGVINIGSSAFDGCSNLTSIVIPDSVTSIGSLAFANCSALTSITIPTNVTSISSYALSGCTGLTSIIVESGNAKYDSRNNCNAIIEQSTNELIIGCKTTIVPNSVKAIGSGAFNNCSTLTSIVIPNTVTYISNSAFSGCTGLTSITVESGNAIYDSRNNCNAIIKTSTNELIAGCKTTIIPSGVVRIGNGAFDDCSTLTSIVIPNTVTYIASRAFAGCSALTSIEIPNTVTYIGVYAFSNCPDSLFEINNGAKYLTDTSGKKILCDLVGSVKSCTVDANTRLICRRALESPNLESITVESGNAVYDSRDNCNAVIETASNTLIASCKNTIIPNSIVTIGEESFYNSLMTSIMIPNSVISIDNEAFLNCSRLTTITISSSVTSIGINAFRGCTNLATAKFENATGWSVRGIFSSSTYTSITTPTTEMTASNATLLKSTYADYYWKRG